MPKINGTTFDYILEKTAPIFNKQGYVGTSLSDLTKATGLTKGAIYCNFTNKEDLALKAFEYNIKKAVVPLFKLIAQQDSSLNKLYTITDYFRTYYDVVKIMGGCPMMRVGSDTKFNHPALFVTAQKISHQFISGLIEIIKDGIRSNEINKNTDVINYAKLMLSLIEGSTFLATTHDDPTYLTSAMDFIDTSIIEKIAA